MAKRISGFRLRISEIKPTICTQQSALVLVSLFLLLSGCASTSDLDAMRGDVNQLKRDTFETKKEVSELRKDMNAVKQLVAGAAKEESFSAIRESQTSLYSQVSDMSKDVQVLRGRFDEYKFFVDKSLKESITEKELLRSQVNSLEMRVKELNEKIAKLTGSSAEDKRPAEQQEAKAEEEKKKDEPEKGMKTAGSEISEGNASKAYEAALNLFKEKKYREAREKFNAFIKKFPKDDRSDNAQFWIGETYYAEKDFEGAILAYEGLIKAYPNSKKMPGALLKQGMSFLELRDKKTAKVIFQKLLDRYPDSKEAEVAKKKMNEADKKPAKAKLKH